jgi:hypothetical protein
VAQPLETHYLPPARPQLPITVKVLDANTEAETQVPETNPTGAELSADIRLALQILAAG